ETAAAIERIELVVVIDVQPFGAAVARQRSRLPHEITADAASLAVRMDGRVEQEGVYAPIPGDVDEADEAVAVRRGDPAEASLEYRPPILVAGAFPGGLAQRVQFVIGDGTVPFDGDWQRMVLLPTLRSCRRGS